MPESVQKSDATRGYYLDDSICCPFVSPVGTSLHNQLKEFLDVRVKGNKGID